MHRPRLEAAQKPPYDGINGNGRLLSRNFRKMNNSLKDRLVRHMEDGHYEPQSKSELARALNVDSRQKQDFRALWTSWRRKAGSCGCKRGDTP